MPAHKVVISQAAEHDLQEIGDYIARDNPRKASETVRRIINQIDHLTTFPRRHPIREDLPEGHRFLGVGNYLAVYRVDEEYVYIVRVVEGSRDMKRLIRNEDAGLN